MSETSKRIFQVETSIKRLIESVISDAIEFERERIIKLLESLNCPANGIEHDCNNDLGDYTPSDLIALIKGEQK